MSAKSCPFLYVSYTIKIRHNFMDIQYVYNLWFQGNHSGCFLHHLGEARFDIGFSNQVSEICPFGSSMERNIVSGLGMERRIAYKN